MRRVLALLVVLMVAGGALRGVQAAHPSRYQSQDEGAYIGIARSLVEKRTYGGKGMTDPAHWVPGAPLMFTLGYKATRPSLGYTGYDVPGVYVEQAIVGTLTIGAAFLLAMLLAGNVAALLAAALVAFYPPLVQATGDMLSEPLGALLVTLGLAATVWALRDPRPVRAAVCGLLLAATVLTRADLALLPAIGVLAVGYVAWRRASARRPRAVLRAAVPLLVGAAVLLVPWSAYASHISGKFVPLSSGGESVFFMGTYLPGHGSLFGAKKALAAETRARYPKFKDLKYFQIKQRDIILTVAGRRPELPQAKALSAAGWENLRTYAVKQPVAYAHMMVDKAWRLWGSYSVGTKGNPRAWIRTYHLVLITIGVLGLIGGLALAGRGRRAPFALLLVVLAYVTAVNMVLVSEARHNMPVMPLVACVGVAGIVMAVRGLRARRADADAGAGAGAGAGASGGSGAGASGASSTAVPAPG